MFDVIEFGEMDCLLCKKTKPCLQVRCKQGTISGPLCAKCLFAQCEARSAAKPKDAPTLFSAAK